MIQYTAPHNIREIDADQEIYLLDWCRKKEYNADELSIGQLIDFLLDDTINTLRIGKFKYWYVEQNGMVDVDVDDELVNVLWEAVKKKLKLLVDK